MKEETPSSLLIALKCTYCDKTYDPSNLIRLCTCGKVLFADYNLEGAKESLTKDSLSERPYDIWRMHEIMPVLHSYNRITLGEGWTPTLKLDRLGNDLQLDHLYVKDEGLNPTGSFKSRGLCAAVAKAKELGVTDFVIPTAGNAGAALAAYAARIGAKAHVFMPIDSPEFIQKEVSALGADLHLVEGLITDAGKVAKEEGERNKWFDVSTLKEPYRVEGKKTMGLELAEQFNWKLPDAIIYPTGGGTGIVGMWKAFDELEKIGLISGERPRMITVQASGCAPIVSAFHSGGKHAEFWQNAETFAAGLRVPAAIGDYLILEALRNSKGTAISVEDKDIMNSMRELARIEGIMLSPEAAATVSAVKALVEKGELDRSESIVLFGTGSGLTTPEEW